MSNESPSTGDGLDLMVKLLEHNADSLAFVTNGLLAGYRRDLAEARATLDLVRHRVGVLYASPYAPSERMVTAALYPPGAAVHELAEDYLAELAGGEVTAGS